MAISVSLINMKGGVGKTTVATQLAHSARRDGYRVLAVDLDPQSNLSQALMGPRDYVRYLDEGGSTIAQIFDDYIPTKRDAGATRPLDVQDVIVAVSRGLRQTKGKLDLIPSRLELSRTLKNPTGKERRPAKSLAQVSDQYDLILIDCAPTESILTEAAYFASRYMMVPIKPEFMATIGLPLLARSLEDFRLENDDHEIEIAGLCFVGRSYYGGGPETRDSIKEVREQAKQNEWYVFQERIRHSESYPRASREATPIKSTPNVQTPVWKEFDSFKDAFYERVRLVQEESR